VGRVIQKGKRGETGEGSGHDVFLPANGPTAVMVVAVMLWWLSSIQTAETIEPVPFTLNALLRNVQAVDARRFSWGGCGRRSIEGAVSHTEGSSTSSAKEARAPLIPPVASAFAFPTAICR